MRGRNYQCQLPSSLSPDAEKGQENKRPHAEPSRTPFEIMEALSSAEGCVKTVIGYWTYSYCHHKHLRQFHDDPNQQSSVPNEAQAAAAEDKDGATSLKAEETAFVLGVYDAATEPPATEETPLKMWHQERLVPYFAERITGGTLCDLTGKPRETEVRFICNRAAGAGQIVSIEEGPTCMYELVVGSALLCRHSKYRVRSSREVSPINCRAELLPGESPSQGGQGHVKKGPGVTTVPMRDLVSEALIIIDNDQDLTVDNIAKALVEVANSKGLPLDDVLTQPDTAETINVVLRDLLAKRQDQGWQEVSLPPSHEAAMKFLRSNCITLNNPGEFYWQYRLCLGDGTLVQHHTEATDINMGTYSKPTHEAAWSKLSSFARNKINRVTNNVYLFENGDYCETIDDDRRSMLLLVCDKDAASRSVYLALTERNTCEYEVKLTSKSFCKG